jgi:hypothetical protein
MADSFENGFDEVDEKGASPFVLILSLSGIHYILILSFHTKAILYKSSFFELLLNKLDA